MFEPHSIRPNSAVRFVSVDAKPIVSAAPAPTQNHLLGALPSEDYKRLLQNLDPVPLPLGSRIYSPGDKERYLYFIAAGTVSWVYVTASGSSAEFALTGTEGVIGISSFLGGESCLNEAVVLNAGYAYRLRADKVNDEFQHGGALPHLLLLYTQALIAQIGQIAVCNRCHRLEQRLCRWILFCLDRLPSDKLTMTHELIAGMLGVRRESVTTAAGILKDAGVINFRRGQITVLDRSQLEARVCECYAVVNREYTRLLPPGWHGCPRHIPKGRLTDHDRCERAAIHQPEPGLSKREQLGAGNAGRCNPAEHSLR